MLKSDCYIRSVARCQAFAYHRVTGMGQQERGCGVHRAGGEGKLYLYQLCKLQVEDDLRRRTNVPGGQI